MPEDILNKVISFIAGDSDGGDDKQVLLKQIAREIQQNKYAKFYHVRQGEADVSFAQYFYNIYKIVYPAWVYLKDPANISRIKHVTIESFLDKPTMDIIKRLTPEAVAERRKTAGPGISKELEADLAALTAGFDSPKLAAADKCYNLIAVLNRFVSWNYYAFLKKFDPSLAEKDFSSTPKFSSLNTDIIMADISAFMSILPSFESNDDWKTVFEILKYCKGGTDLIPFEIWNGLLSNLKDLRQSKILECMVRLASGNPVWEPKAAPAPHEQLSSVWLDHKNAEIRQVIMDIADSQRNTQIAVLEKTVFGSADTIRLSFYTKEKGKILTQKDLAAYVYAPALNHLVSFIQDFMSKEMQELGDIMLVRGQWTNSSASRAMSDGYHDVVEILPEITALDESLSEEGGNGPRLRGALLRVDRDPGQARYINSIITTLNEEALNIINRAVQSLIIVGKHLKMLVDDSQKKPYELIMNWKELVQVSKTPITQRLADDYKKVNYFVQLMLLETRQQEE
ncbi:MAG: DUF5312 family protein [Treponema sp.]|jgi:hypothetical protein|nr:DUF5312 family protein [Treponema sp.]